MNWTNVLTLRPEPIGQDGQLSDLQMSLFSAVYQTRPVPYRDVAYYGEITEPTPRLLGFMGVLPNRDRPPRPTRGGTAYGWNGERRASARRGAVGRHYDTRKPSPEFGPATSLFERFLWGLFDGDYVKYDQFVAKGSDKAALVRAMTSFGGPLLSLLDELMDYALALSDRAHIAGMPGEQAFLNALMAASCVCGRHDPIGP